MFKYLTLSVLLCGSLVGNAKDYVITKYGASTDSTILNTSSIQKTIDLASSKGGGTIVIPKGVFLSGALFFKPGTQLRLEEGAMIKGSDNIVDYPLVPSRMEGQKLDYYAALINAYQVDSFKISGPGTINGNGLRFWTAFWAYRDSMKKQKKTATNLDCHRPRLLFIWGCNNLVIKNVNLRNSGFWTTHLYQCNNVKILNCNIQSPYRPVAAPSTDGIDIDVCSNLLIKGCYISVNDDAICIKGGKGPNAHKLPENGVVENITIEDCTIGESHGTLTLGSESIHARNIVMRNCKVDSKNTPLLRIKMRPDTYQTFENISLENISGVVGTVVAMNPWKQFFDMQGSTEKPKGIVRNILLKNITLDCKSIGEFNGNPVDTIENIVFRNVTLKAENDTLKTAYKTGIIFDNVIVNGTKRDYSPLKGKK